MNFLIRSTTTVYSERSPIPEPRVDTHQRSASAGSSYEAHKSDVPYSSRYDSNVELNSKNRDLPELAVIDKHVDVDEDDGWITIPCSMFLPSVINTFIYCFLTRSNMISSFQLCNYTVLWLLWIQAVQI